MRRLRRLGLGLVGGAAIAAGVGALNRALLLDDLPPTLPGAATDWEWRGIRVRATTLGSGPPVVLLHGIHAAASAFEYRGIFEPLSAEYRVIALEWPGFGKSERRRIAYDATLYGDLLRAFLQDVVSEPAVLVASSLSAVFAVEAAARDPARVRGLVLLSPTSVTGLGSLGPLFGRLLRLPLVGEAAFNLLVSKGSIRSYLGRVYDDDALVDDGLVEQHWATAHQPNARLAPAAFVAGAFDRHFAVAHGLVSAPILVVRGSGPHLGPAPRDPELEHLNRGHVRLETISECGQLPHDEAPDDALGLLRQWLATLRD